jgi:ABC-2 type transport system ATP-binding protein
MNDAIVTRRLVKYYGKQRVVDCLDLRIAKGCVYGLLGRNGAGKSTTIKMLLGLVHPDSGSIEILGQDVRNFKPADRTRIAYLAENHPLYRDMTIRSAIAFFRPFHPTWNQGLVDQLFEHFALPTNKKIRRFSNGQRAQVALALALAPDPELLILDDPTLGLDTVVRRDFLESMIQVIHRQGRTILFSSHILNDVERVADRIGVMVDGVLRVDCPVDDFRANVTKVVLEFDREPLAFPAMTGVVGSRRVRNKLEVVVVRFDSEHERRIESLGPKRWEKIELNLEDAFIEYTRGNWRPLPYFGGEANHVESAIR